MRTDSAHHWAVAGYVVGGVHHQNHTNLRYINMKCKYFHKPSEQQWPVLVLATLLRRLVRVLAIEVPAVSSVGALVHLGLSEHNVPLNPLNPLVNHSYSL